MLFHSLILISVNNLLVFKNSEIFNEALTVEFQSYANESLKFLIIRKTVVPRWVSTSPEWLRYLTEVCRARTNFSGFLCKFYFVLRIIQRASWRSLGIGMLLFPINFCFSFNWICFPCSVSHLPQIFKSQIFSFLRRSDYNNLKEIGSRTAGRTFSRGKCIEGTSIH